MTELYRAYSTFLKEKYGEKVYKLPINLPVTCPNRDGKRGTGGCIFCGEKGAGFENLSNVLSVREQLSKNMDFIRKKYKAKKFIPYFQTYTSTYIPVERFAEYINEACLPEVVALALSTRPDCIGEEYLDVLSRVKTNVGVDIDIELGLQTANDDTLRKLNRGHDVRDFVDAAIRVKQRGFSLCAHIILDLPWDTRDDVTKTARLMNELHVDHVKLHSLYVVKGTELARMYETGEALLLEMDEYIERVMLFLGHLKSDIVIQRIIGRAPEQDTLVANWNTSWWKIKDMIEERMRERGIVQGSFYSEQGTVNT